MRKRAGKDARVIAAREALLSAQREIQPRLREELDEVMAEVVLEEQQKLAAEFDSIHTVERAVQVGSLDAVIAPRDLRPEIIRRLRLAAKEQG
ncbi:MAG: acetyl-CoA carboxylase carboxyltransferase component [Bradymonadia bacterium]